MRNNSIKVTIFSLLGYPLSRKPMMGRSYSQPYVCREYCSRSPLDVPLDVCEGLRLLPLGYCVQTTGK